MQQVYFSSIVVVWAVFSHLYECGFLTPFICSFILNTQVGWMKIEVLTEVWQKMFKTKTIWGTIPRQVLEERNKRTWHYRAMLLKCSRAHLEVKYFQTYFLSMYLSLWLHGFDCGLATENLLSSLAADFCLPIPCCCEVKDLSDK